MSENDTTTGPDDFGDMFDSWIAGATLAQKSVDIYGDPALQAEYEVLERELEKAKAVAKGGETSQADAGEVERIEEQMVELYEKWMASKSTWYVRALPSEIAAAVAEEHPEIPEPSVLKPDATVDERNEHAAAVKAYKAAADNRNFAILPQLVVRIDWPGDRSVKAVYDDDGVRFKTPAVTSQQLRSLRTRLGDIQYLRLLSASQLANLQEPVVPAPFLRSNSENEKT